MTAGGNFQVSNDHRCAAKMAFRSGAATIAAIAVFLIGLPPAAADSLNITYYTISSSDPDANNLSGGVVNNEVQSILGPNALPILNTPAFGCVSNCFSLPSGPKNLTAGGEITYWAPSLNPFVSQTGTGVVTLPFNVPSNFFPPNGTGSSNGGANGFQAALLSGNLTVPANTSESISFSIGADDMAFAYLDSQVICDLGGVHPSAAGTCILQQSHREATACNCFSLISIRFSRV